MRDEISLYYEQRGTGFPLILLHGNNESHEYFAGQIEFFSHYYRVIAPDTRGHGRSPRGDAPFTIRQFADDLHDFMAEQGIGKAHILGFSDGGNIALCFALKYPNMVSGLVLNGANLTPSGVKAVAQLPVEIGYRIARLFAGRSEAARAHAEMLGLMVNDPNIEASELNVITAPTLVIVGDRDMIKPAHSRLIAGAIPGAKLCVVHGNHFVAGRNPEQFNRAVFEFLSGLSATETQS